MELNQTGILQELRRITATDEYKRNGITRVKEVTAQPWEPSGARITLEIMIDDFNVNPEDIVSDTWEITCEGLDILQGVPLFLVPRAQIKVYDDHPILWAFDDEIFYSVTNSPANISALMGELFIEHTKACVNWVDFHDLYSGLPGSFERLADNQLAVPKRLKEACFGVFGRHGVQYRINTVQENDKGDRLLLFSNPDIWPDDENFKQAYIIAKDFSERRIG